MDLLREILNFLKDCYILFTGLPICKPLSKYTTVSGKFHSSVLLREYTCEIIDYILWICMGPMLINISRN